MATLFDGQTARSRFVSLTVDSRSLRLIDTDTSLPSEWLLAECTFEIEASEQVTVHFQNQRAELTSIEWTELQRFLPKKQIQNHKATLEVAVRYGSIILALLGVSILSLPLFADQVVRWVSIDREREWFENSHRLKSEDTSIRTTLKQFVTLLEPEDSVEVVWSDSSEVNAYAIPGAKIVITQGLTCFVRSPEELLAVMAHEIEHIERRHVLKGFVKQVGFNLVWHWLLSGIGNFGIAKSLIENRYSILDETEADTGAVQRLVKVGIDPIGGAHFFERIAAQKSLPVLELLVRNHPLTADRIAFFKSHSLTQSKKLSPFVEGLLMELKTMAACKASQNYL